ncbi:MAG: proline--tRNA ligase [Alphaproteobacteria bacterium]|nr:proline--tRNA ligase [Alphaproteobacteria bacterium]
MYLSRYFLPVLRETPKEAEIVSHQLMLRAGMIKQCAAGIYSWLPLGLRVLKKIEQIVREEQNRAGAVEVMMPTIQPADLWRESGRYEAYGKEMLRITDRHKRDLLFGPTAEEVITSIFRDSVKSYKDLPKNLYNIQWKFRDEIRPRFGVMRGREFLMKDAYSFDLSPEAARKSYQRMFAAYLRTFARMGLRSIPMKADTGPIGGDLSHEFIILAETGESQVFCHRDLIEGEIPPVDTDYDGDLEPIMTAWTSKYAATEDMHDPARFAAEVPSSAQVSARGIEVGHIFFFGRKYSKPMDCRVQGPDGQMATVEMGSYGVGVSRLAGAIIEANHDDNGIRWPMPVAPFEVAVINLKAGDGATDGVCAELHTKLEQAGIDVLVDDSDERAGGKFATMDLIGIPLQIVVGPKGVKSNTVEIKSRVSGEKESLTPETAINHIVAEVKRTRILA